MASCTYFSTIFTIVILGCLLLGNGVTSDDKGNIDNSVNKISTGQHEMNLTETFMENNSDKNCSLYNNCEDCAKSNCTWTFCAHSDYECSDQPEEMCPEVDCTNGTTTISPNETTTSVPTTVPTTTDTEPPSTNTTTTSTATPNTTTSTTATPNTTTTSTPITTTSTPNTTTSTSTTSVPATTPPPTTAAPHTRHFDAGSFVGGIILTLTLAAVSFAAWKFYRRRSLATSYTNF